MEDECTKIRVTILVTPHQSREMDALKAKTGISKGQIARTAIAAYLRHTVEEQPTCADGTMCLCLGRWGKVGKPERIVPDVT